MNSDQIKAHTAGFLHALAVNPDLAARWQTDMSNEDRAGMIAQHLGLAEPPSQSDLQSMTSYAKANLSDAIAKATPGGAQPLSIVMQES